MSLTLNKIPRWICKTRFGYRKICVLNCANEGINENVNASHECKCDISAPSDNTASFSSPSVWTQLFPPLTPSVMSFLSSIRVTPYFIAGWKLISQRRMTCHPLSFSSPSICTYMEWNKNPPWAFYFLSGTSIFQKYWVTYCSDSDSSLCLNPVLGLFCRWPRNQCTFSYGRHCQ